MVLTMKSKFVMGPVTKKKKRKIENLVMNFRFCIIFFIFLNFLKFPRKSSRLPASSSSVDNLLKNLLDFLHFELFALTRVSSRNSS